MTPLFFLIARSFSRPFWKSRQKLGVGTEEIRAEVKALNAGVLSNASGQMAVEENVFI